MKLALIGRSMISPFGLAMRPRIPASWRICEAEPRAPEVAIIAIGFIGSRWPSSASPTSLVAESHSPVTSSWRSSCVISPSSYWLSIVATCSSYLARISALSGGVWASFLENVTPARVAYLKPTSLKASSTWEIDDAPYFCTRPSIIVTESRLRIAWLANS